MNNEELNKELEEFAQKVEDCYDVGEEHGYLYCQRGDIKNAVITGAKWQKEQMISALKNDGDLPIEFIDKFHEIDRTAFQNGQANMREQMMKEAVEGEIQMRYSGSLCAKTTHAINEDKFKLGDKVCIIVVRRERK